MENIEKTVSLRVNPTIPAYINCLAAELTLQNEGDKVKFSDIVRDFLEEGIDSGRLKAFAMKKYLARKTSNKEAA